MRRSTDTKYPFDLPTERLSRDQAWRQAYRLRPYLEIDSATELAERFEDILLNIYSYTAEGKVGAISLLDGAELWAQKTCDLQLEYRRRGYGEFTLDDPKKIPLLLRENLNVVRQNLELFPLTVERGIYCRYGPIRWMTELLENGTIRLNPASYYNKSTFNRARQDDEMVIQSRVTPYDYDLGLVPLNHQRHIPERSWSIIDHEKPTDHYIYCVCLLFDFRYFFDFSNSSGPADACVRIQDQAEFEARLQEAVRLKLPEWWVGFETIRYVDPCSTRVPALPAANQELYFFKDMRFMYQREARLVAVPPNNWKGLQLDPIDIEIGSLKDIAELVVFNVQGAPSSLSEPP